MKDTKFLISVLCFAVFMVADVAEARITIDPASKFLEHNGEKRFFVFTGDMCAKFSEASTESCSATLSHNPNVDGVFGETWMSFLRGTGYANDDLMNNAKKYWFGLITQSSLFSTDPASTGYYWRSLPYFAGYSHSDEPDLTSHNVSLSTLQTSYNKAKSADPSRPVILTISGVDPAKGFVYYKDVADIFMSDKWTQRTGQPWDSTKDWVYALEREYEFFAWRSIPNIETWDKPIIGFVTTQTALCGGQKDTPQTVRTQTYTMVATGVKGIRYYPNKDYLSDCVSSAAGNYIGYWNNPVMYNYINNVMANELHSFKWLLTPSVAKSWGKTTGTHIDLNSVVFSNNPTKTIKTYGGSDTHKRFNYMLKYADTKYYLIVVNKDYEMTTTDITISRLAGSGTMTAKTIGLETTGSAKAGRTLTVTNGKFTDTFDGFGAHVYEISSGTSSPAPTCSDGIQNQAETGIDCGGPCPACASNPPMQLILKPGWNQISSPIAAGIDIATIEQNCTILPYKAQKLWGWNATSQVWINPTKVEPLKGYWIYAAYACTVPLSGVPVTFTSLPLTVGWNKISAQGSFSAISGTCSGHIIGNWIWNWDKATEKWIHPTTMQLDKGYWIKVDQNCILGG